MPIHAPSARRAASDDRQPGWLGRTVKRDFPPRHATPSRTPRNASNVVAPTSGMLRTNCTERQRPLGPYLRRANWTANSWAACVMSAAATEWKPSQVYCLNFVTPPAPAFGAAGSPRAAARCRQIPRAASQGALSRTAGPKVALDGPTHGRAIERAGRGSAPDRPADYPSRVEDHARGLV
jgi:hypothetical protein